MSQEIQVVQQDLQVPKAEERCTTIKHESKRAIQTSHKKLNNNDTLSGMENIDKKTLDFGRLCLAIIQRDYFIIFNIHIVQKRWKTMIIFSEDQLLTENEDYSLEGVSNSIWE